MPTGRPPIPAHLKLLRGNPGQYPVKTEPQPEQHDDIPDPPTFVTGYAADEWWSVATELYRLRLLTKIDVAMLAAYCMAYARWRTAEEQIAKMAAHDPIMLGLVYDGAINPLISVARNAAHEMRGFAVEFGLSPVSRCRLGTPPAPKAKGKFDGLVAS
jgi:P27 family predicted phage terminase small subunit